MHTAINDAKDNLLAAKISQAFEANKTRSVDKPFPYNIGDLVLMSTLHNCSAFISGNGKRVAKFLPCFDGPYEVTDTYPESSTVTFNLPNQPSTFPTFHIHLVKPFLPNDDEKFPHHRDIHIEDNQEFFVESIVDHKSWDQGHCYLVKFQGYPESFNH